MSLSTELKATSPSKAIGLDRKTSQLSGALLIALSDFLAFSLSLVLAFWTRIYVIPIFLNINNTILFNSIRQMWWLPFLGILVMAYKGFYRRRFPYWHEVRIMINIITVTFSGIILFLFLTKSAQAIPRTILVLTYLYSLFLLPITRYFVKSKITSLGLWLKPVLILGAGKTAELVIQGFRREKTMGYDPIGMLEDNPVKRGIASKNRIIPILGRFSDIEEVMKRSGVKDIIVAVPGMKNGKLVELTNKLQHLSANILLVPDLFGIPLAGVKIDFLFDEKVLLMSMPNNLASRWNMFLKRMFDLVLGSIILILISPIMLLIIIAIRLDSKGPALFSHTRLGKDGKCFKCLKFRTMVTNAQEVLENLLKNDPEIRKEWEKDFKLKKDPRITRIGKILRKTSLDELPQLLNVIKGEMSLVGPRPIITEEIEKYGYYYEVFKRVSPGITGLWQVSGRNDVDYEDRVQLDVWYIHNWSIWMDIMVLIRTIGVVLARNGAY